jgi:hypothetical protein
MIFSVGCVFVTKTPSNLRDFSSRQNTRFVVRADEKLTAIMELEAAVRTCGELA